MWDTSTRNLHYTNFRWLRKLASQYLWVAGMPVQWNWRPRAQWHLGFSHFCASHLRINQPWSVCFKALCLTFVGAGIIRAFEDAHYSRFADLCWYIHEYIYIYIYVCIRKQLGAWFHSYKLSWKGPSCRCTRYAQFTVYRFIWAFPTSLRGKCLLRI